MSTIWWIQMKDCTKEAWELIRSAAMGLTAVYDGELTQTMVEENQGPEDVRPPLINQELIQFNGGWDSHNGDTFQFNRRRRPLNLYGDRPADEYVLGGEHVLDEIDYGGNSYGWVAGQVLLAACYYSPDSWIIGSSGDSWVWDDALNVVRRYISEEIGQPEIANRTASEYIRRWQHARAAETTPGTMDTLRQAYSGVLYGVDPARAMNTRPRAERPTAAAWLDEDDDANTHEDEEQDEDEDMPQPVTVADGTVPVPDVTVATDAAPVQPGDVIAVRPNGEVFRVTDERLLSEVTFPVIDNVALDNTQGLVRNWLRYRMPNLDEDGDDGTDGDPNAG